MSVAHPLAVLVSLGVIAAEQPAGAPRPAEALPTVDPFAAPAAPPAAPAPGTPAAGTPAPGRNAPPVSLAALPDQPPDPLPALVGPESLGEGAERIDYSASSARREAGRRENMWDAPNAFDADPTTSWSAATARAGEWISIKRKTPDMVALVITLGCPAARGTDARPGSPRRIVVRSWRGPQRRDATQFFAGSQARMDRVAVIFRAGATDNVQILLDRPLAKDPVCVTDIVPVVDRDESFPGVEPELAALLRLAAGRDDLLPELLPANGALRLGAGPEAKKIDDMAAKNPAVQADVTARLRALVFVRVEKLATGLRVSDGFLEGTPATHTVTLVRRAGRLEVDALE